MQSAKQEAMPTTYSASGPSGLAVPLSVHNSLSDSDQNAIAQLAADLLEDPWAIEQLSQRVFELLQTELYYAQERSRGYGR